MSSMYQEFQDMLRSERDPNFSQEIKDDIRRLADMYLDVKDVPSNQSVQMRTIEQEVELDKKWPIFFRGAARRKQVIMHMVSHHHALNRQSASRKLEATKRPRAGRPRMTEGEMGERKRKTSKVETQRTTTRKYDDSDRKDRRQVRPPPPPPIHPPVAVHNHVEIREFLDNCTPPMTRLLPAFIDNGYINGEYLHAMSEWSEKRISDVVRRFASVANMPISNMEVEIILAHFLEYRKS